MRRLLSTVALGLALLLAPSLAWAQQGTIAGTVIEEETGDALPGANVQVVGTEAGTATNTNGEFSISDVPTGEQTVRVSFVGYQPAERTVNVESGSTTRIRIQLASDAQALDEVVVTGYGGEQNRRDLTGSVESISADQIEGASVTSPEQFLQGVSGVQLTTTSGMAGSSINVRVRGPSSIQGGNSPLYVVDGVPVISGDFGSDVGTAATNALSDLSTSDIESIEVLKDASATAIYGSRGSNGVVLIETKEGSDQNTQVNFGYQVGAIDATDEWDVLNGSEWSEVYREAFDNYNEIAFGGALGDRPELAFGYPEVPDPSEATNTDWVGEVFEQGLRQQTDLSIRGGNEDTRFYISGALDDSDNYVRGNEFRRMSGRVNLDHDPYDWATVGTNLSVTRTLNFRASSDNLVSAPLTSSALAPPVVDIRNEDGSYNWSNPWNIADNVVASSELNSYDANNWRLLGNAFVELDPIESLTIRSRFGTDALVQEEFFRYVENSTDGQPDGFGGSYYREQRNYTFNTTANYETTVDQHQIGTLVGFEYEYQERNNVFAEATGFPSDGFANIASASSPTTTSANVDRKSRLESYFSRINYSYDDRYILELSGRVDGSTRFSENNRYGFFPAGAVAWRLSQEDFLSGVDYLSELKLRASYGVTGNDQIGGFFDYLPLYAAGNDYDGTPGTAPSQLASPDLQWESVRQLDVGLDVGLFDERIYFSADYYRKDTEDLILPVQTPLTSGFNNVPENVGSMLNDGVDLSLETQNFVGDFSWETNFEVSYLQNEVQELASDEPIISGTQIAREGEELGAFFLIPYEGVDPENGRPIWIDEDGEETFDPNASDRRIAGSALPTWTGSVTNQFSYSGFQLRVQLQFEEGRDVYNDTYRFMMNPATFNLHEDYLDRWQEPGDQTDVPRNVFADLADNSTRQSTRWLEDGSYIRVKDVSLSYNVPSDFLESYGLRNARVFVRGTNLFTFDRLSVGDPEGVSAGDSGVLNSGDVFFTPPQQRTITGGVEIGL